MCKIDDAGAKSLGEAITQAGHLQVLILSHNQISVN